MIARTIRLFHSLAGAEDKGRWVENKVAWRRFRARSPREHIINQAFDRRHGTETAEEIPLAQTGVPLEDAARGNGIYRPMWESEFHAALAALDSCFRGFTFVDLGSGKGKVLMLASEYPFARIVGVEYSPGLHAIAQRNVARYRSPTQLCNVLQPVLGDARHYRLPDGPIVCFIFNAFDPGTMQKVMQNIEDDLGSRAVPGYVIYANVRTVSEIENGFGTVKKLRRAVTTRKLVVFSNAVAQAL